MSTRTINGTYGSQQTPCTVICEESRNGTWYAVEGSRNVNFTPEHISNGVDVETLADTDYFYHSAPIESEEDLETALTD